jgi:mycobactin lysine-N-oxygenase
MDQQTVSLAVLGAGPKGVSLLAKHSLLVQDGLEDANKIVPSIAVFDDQGTASNWTGLYGYTDGMQKIVNPVDQDVGHPYLDTLGVEGIGRRMLDFSLPRYKALHGKHSEWVLGDRRTNHSDFTKYLEWVLGVSRSADRIIPQRIEKLTLTERNGRNVWLLRLGNHSEYEAEGLVITGNGAPIDLKGMPNSWRLMNGKTFWERTEKLKTRIKSGESIVIIGAGETAGTIALRALSIAPSNTRIHLVYDQGAFYSRGQSFGETIWFSNPESSFQELKWTDLSYQDRRAIIERADRGVLSVNTKQLLETHHQITPIVGRVVSITAVVGHPNEFTLDLSYDGQPRQPEVFNFVINALGFNHLWFLKLMDAKTRRKFVQHLLALNPLTTGDPLFDEAVISGARHTRVPEWIAAHVETKQARKWIQETIERNIERDLSLRGFSPRLHLPMLSGPSQGPGFPNLNCLGLLSDRILQTYI